MTREGELEAVRQQGKRLRTGHLEIRHIASLLPHSRAGVIVPRYSHGAVERNRVKRQVREIVRLDVLPALGGVDVLVRALPSAYQATYAELREECRQARNRITGETER